MTSPTYIKTNNSYPQQQRTNLNPHTHVADPIYWLNKLTRSTTSLIYTNNTTINKPRHSHSPMSRNGIHRLSSDRKSTRLNSSHANISYAVFCLKKKKKNLSI